MTLDDFGDGIDRRGGVIARSAKKFYSLVNYFVTAGRKIKMRPPLLKFPGGIDTAVTQGCEYLNGQITTVAAAGTTPAHSAVGIGTIYFDVPEGSTSTFADWELLELVVYNEQMIALIRHHFPASLACPYRNYLHVFDNKRPTYTEDPACPPSWAPAYPMQPYGEGRAGSYKDYRPRLSVIADRLAMFTAGGDTAFCGVGLPRVWNTLSPAEIMANGEMFYRILDATGSQHFTFPVKHADLVTEQRYAAYVLEYLNPDGTWSQFTEVSSASGPGEYNITPATNRFDATADDETEVVILPSADTPDGTLIRFRAIPDPTVTIQNGLYLTAKTIPGQLIVEGGNTVGGTMVHEGKSYNVQSLEIPDLESPYQKALVCVTSPNAPVNVDVLTGADSTTSPFNGQQRYWSHIIAQIIANGEDNQRSDLAMIYKAKYGVSGSSTYTAGAYYVAYNYASDKARLYGLNVAGITVGQTIKVKSAVFVVAEIIAGDTLIDSASVVITIAKANVMRCTPVSGADTIPAATLNKDKDATYTWYTVGFNGGYTYAIDGRTAITVGGTRLDGAATVYTTQLAVGFEVEVNGEKRKVVSITSDTVAEVELPFTTAGSFIALRDPIYQYAADVGDTGNEWYATKEAEITLTGSGKDDALTLGTANYDPSGAMPTAMAAMDNRLLVHYPSVLQSWAVGPNVGDFRRLAVMGQGAGSINTRPQPVLVDGYAGLPTVNGPRLFAPENNNKDYVEFVAVGDMLRGITLPDLSRAVWWPRLRVWISCAATGTPTFYVLSVHKDAKVLAWATWTMIGLTTVDAMFVKDDLLVVKSGATLYYFDADATTHVDANGAYTATARWLYNDLGSPQRNKKLIRCEIVQNGISTVGIRVNPRSLDPVHPPREPITGDPQDDRVDGPVMQGTTVGMQRFPVMAMGPGIALEVSSIDPTGHELDSLGFDYLLLNR